MGLKPLTLIAPPKGGAFKPCCKCGVEKPHDEFYRRTKAYDGLTAHCKECDRKAPWRQEKTRRDYDYKRKYGISLEDYNEMFYEQHGSCGICGKHQEELRGRLCVDHSHETGEVRGLLCQECNSALGMLGDSIESIQKAMEYLNESKRL